MRKTLRIVVIVTAVIIGIWAAAYLAATAWLFPSKTTKISAYPDLLEAWTPTGLVDHFPKMLPTAATDVSLAGAPGFLQGSGYLQLRVKLPPKEVEAISTRAKASAVRTCPSQCSDNLEDPQFWSVPRLFAGSKSEEPFPSDFTVYALETDGDWNHPTGKGIAVSVARSEVVYWADD